MSDRKQPPSLKEAIPSQRLTRQFQAFEKRGRGWHLYDYLVTLEPAFEHYERSAGPASPVVDDARKQTLLASLIESIRQRSTATSLQNVTPSSTTEAAHPPADKATPHQALIEIRINLPSKLKISHEAAERFLLSLTHASSPTSFEVIGVPGLIVIQFCCREEDYAQLRHQLQAFFPELVLSERANFLEDQWTAGEGKQGVIVDYGLLREFMRPLNALTGFEVADPLISVAGALSDVRQGEVALLQVLFQAARQPWPESILSSVTDASGKPFFAGDPDLVSLAKKKVSRPLFAAVVRVAAKSDSCGRALALAKSIGGSLAQFSSPTGNELIPLSNEGYDDELHEYGLLHRCTYRSGMILNSEELTSVVHPPSSVVRSENLRRDEQNTRPAPSISIGHELFLGENAHNGIVSRVTLSPEQRSKHTYVTGVSGTGKSTLLLSMIMQDVCRGEGVGVLDPHGDLIAHILDRIPAYRHEDVILLDPADEEYPIGFNILAANSELEKNLLSSDLVAVFRRLSTSWGDQMTSVLGNAVLAFLESTQGGTLADLRRFLIESDFRRAFLTTVTDREVVYYWQKEFPLLSGKPQAPLLTRLDTFLRPKLIRHMVGQKENRLDFRNIMDGRKIFLAKLSQGAIGEENSYLLGTLIVSKLHQMALGRQAIKESERQPFYLYIDEFQNFITPSMASILSGARKLRLALIIAHQEFRQLWNQNTDVASAVIANPYARVCFRLGDFDAQKFQEGFAHFEAKDFQNLSVGEAIARIERSEFDFNLKTVTLPPVGKDVARANQERIVTLSRQRYASNHSDVEAALARTMHAPAQQDPSVVYVQTEQKQKAEPEAAQSVPLSDPVVKPAVPRPAVKKESKFREASTPTPATLGRGGQQHRYLQQLIKRLAEDKGFRVVIEQPVLGGTGSVDVSMEKGESKIACEISVTSTGEYELQNIQKCLAAGYDPVILLSSEKKTLGKVQKLAAAQLDEESRLRVLYFLPEEFVSYLEQIEAAGMGSEDTVRGYKVKVNYKAVDAADSHVRKQAISQVILQALRRMKNSRE